MHLDLNKYTYIHTIQCYIVDQRFISTGSLPFRDVYRHVELMSKTLHWDRFIPHVPETSMTDITVWHYFMKISARSMSAL